MRENPGARTSSGKEKMGELEKATELHNRVINLDARLRGGARLALILVNPDAFWEAMEGLPENMNFVFFGGGHVPRQDSPRVAGVPTVLSPAVQKGDLAFLTEEDLEGAGYGRTEKSRWRDGF